MFEQFDYIPEPPPATQYKMLRSFSNSNPSLVNRLPNSLPDGGIPNNAISPSNNNNNNTSANNNIQVEYEVSVPIVQSYRHTPYHSLWNLNQWFVFNVFAPPFPQKKEKFRRISPKNSFAHRKT